MKKRIDSFSLLLGGVQDFDVDQVVEADERWRNEVIQIAKKRLASSAGVFGQEVWLSTRDPILLKVPHFIGQARRVAPRMP